MSRIAGTPFAFLRPRALDGLEYRALAVCGFFAAHALTLLLAGAHARVGSYAFLIAAPIVTATLCVRRIRLARDAQGWVEIALAMLLWAGGMATNMSVDLMLAPAGEVPGISMLLYVLYGVPLIFAVASPAHEAWYIRTVDGILALALGVLLWVHTFSFASFDRASDEGVLAIRWLFDIENSFIAIFALVRWRASADPARRLFFRTLAIFACLYFAAAGMINHFASEIAFGNAADLVIDIPFLWLAWALGEETPQPASAGAAPFRPFVLAVRAGSPLMLPAMLLAVAGTLLWRTTGFAAVGFVTATLGYGLRNVLAQMRGIAEQDRLDQLSRLDALTGLPNRRQFDETLRREWSRARRSGGAIAVLIVDIDHFKLLNDGLGHLVGDARLREVAQELSACISRGGDFVGRYGGEEFVAILPDVPEAVAYALAEKMRKAIVMRSLPTPAPQGIVTVSIGFAWMGCVDADAPERLVAAADAALYRAKAGGRNRVECGTIQP